MSDFTNQPIPSPDEDARSNGEQPDRPDQPGQDPEVRLEMNPEGESLAEVEEDTHESTLLEAEELAAGTSLDTEGSALRAEDHEPHSDVDEHDAPHADDSAPVRDGPPRTSPEGQHEVDWDNTNSPQAVMRELRHIETEVRRLLGDMDPRRRRKLAGSRRWLELHDDILGLRFGGRYNEETLAELRRLIALRHRLFHRLRFLADTRPTWNT
jgi:hypothetical protein